MILSSYSKLWWALYAGMLSLLIVSYFWGSMGKSVLAQQSQEHEAMQANYQALMDIQVMLEATKFDYEHNDETIILKARKVGFFRPDEGLIVVRGAENFAQQWDVGHIVRKQTKVSQMRRWYGVFAFLVSFFLVLMMQFILHKNDDYTGNEE